MATADGRTKGKTKGGKGAGGGVTQVPIFGQVPVPQVPVPQPFVEKIIENEELLPPHAQLPGLSSSGWDDDDDVDSFHSVEDSQVFCPWESTEDEDPPVQSPCQCPKCRACRAGHNAC